MVKSPSEEFAKLAEQWAAFTGEAGQAAREEMEANNRRCMEQRKAENVAEKLQGHVGRNISEKAAVLSDGRVVIVAHTRGVYLVPTF